MIWNLTILLLGLAASLFLFWRLPRLETLSPQEQHKPSSLDTVSVIIPARDEEATLPLLLADLAKQTVKPLEIICVNDGSSDRTEEVIRGFQATLVDAGDKPEEWMGKAWACLKGAEAAGGTLFLFLDADVRLAPDGLAKLIATYEAHPITLSVKPYHEMQAPYEQLSLFFNLVQVAANGTGIPIRDLNIGLFGPVILMSKSDYDFIGGHHVAKRAIADDLALGAALRNHDKKYRLLIGGQDISFRMYGEGLKALLQGWTKNYATGASKTPLPLMILSFLWITSCASAPLHALLSVAIGEVGLAAVYAVFYVIWVLELSRIAWKLGNFAWYAVLFYPFYLLVFLGVFFRSLWKKLLHRQVTWKGRTMNPEG